MGKRQKLWARFARAELLFLLGDKCAICGSAENLELDCINPRGDAHHRTGYDQRVSFYRREHYENQNLQILCRNHHQEKSTRESKAKNYKANPSHRGDKAGTTRKSPTAVFSRDRNE